MLLHEITPYVIFFPFLETFMGQLSPTAATRGGKEFSSLPNKWSYQTYDHTYGNFLRIQILADLDLPPL